MAHLSDVRTVRRGGPLTRLAVARSAYVAEVGRFHIYASVHPVPMHRYVPSLAFFLALNGAPLAGQTGTPGLGHDVATSTRAMALGGAYVMGSGQADAVFQHPSLLRDASGMTLDVQRWGSASGSTSAAAVTSWFGGSVGVAVGVQSMQYGYSDPTPPTGRALDGLFSDTSAPISERAALLGLSRGFDTGDVDWGVALRFSEERVENVRSTDLEVLLGASREVGPVTVGVTFPDVGRTITDVDIGVGAYGWELGPLDLGVSGRLSGFDDEVVAGRGVEVGYWPVRGRTFVGRVGVQSVPDGSVASPVTLGFAYWGDDLVLEWAFQPYDGAPESGTHRFSIGWR